MTEFKQKRKRRTKKEMELVRSTTESVGLGDTVEKVLEATGIAKVAKWILGEDCGCDERKEALNKLFTYRRKIECLQEHEYLFLKDFFTFNKSRLKPTEQSSLLRIYNRVFNQRQEPSGCPDCWKRILNDLQKIVNQYEQEHQDVSGT
jgi:hypothetical protein